MSSHAPYAHELATAKAIARAAGMAILERFQDAAVSTKRDGSFVTEADYAADAAIRAGLNAAFPSDAILTEEGVDDPARLQNDRVWIADPIDGTAYFVARSDDFDVFLALAVGGEPVVAVSLQPVTGLLLSAVAGQGAWIERAGREPTRLRIGPQRSPRVVATKGWLGAPENLPALRAAAERIGEGEVVEATRSLCVRALLPGPDAVDLIAGVPVAPRTIDSWEWDVAAVDLIVREAGGVVSDLAGARLRFNKPDPRFPRGLLIGRDARLHGRVLTALREAVS